MELLLHQKLEVELLQQELDLDLEVQQLLLLLLLPQATEWDYVRRGYLLLAAALLIFLL